MADQQPTVIPSDADLTLVTLGGASLSGMSPTGSPTVLFGPGKPLALITYLAFSPRRTVSRDYLVSLLWAESEPDRAIHALRQTVWQIRQALGEQVLATRGGTLTLEADVASDRDEFLAAVEAGDVERAVALYAGDFLPDFAAPGGAAFEQWADLERVRVRSAFLRCAESLTQRHLASGHVREAQRLARRARDADPLNQGSWRLLLETLQAGDDWTAAAMEADALERLLEVEEREAEPATRAVIRRARKAPEESTPSPRATLVAELVGREREFAAVLAAWDDAKRGTARHVHITAPAGLGKSRLLHDVHARLRAAGVRTVYARAHSGEREIAYAFAADLAAALAALPGAAGLSPGAAAALVALNPSLSGRYAVEPQPTKSEEVLRHRSVAFSELLGTVADEAPVAILLDDLHWADAESLQLLAGLAARLAGHRALLVTTARPVAKRVFEAAPTTLHLAALEEHQVSALVTSIAALPDQPWARELPTRLAWATGGSPLLVLESLQLGLERGALALTADGWACPDPAALASALGAGSALRRRLEELDRATHWLILTLAVAGKPLETETVAQAAGRPAEVVRAALTALEERGLVSRVGAAWEPAHDELTALALDAVPPDALRAARAALGRALAAEAEHSPGMVRQAAQLLAAVNDVRQLQALFPAWVSACRARGDHRNPKALAADLLGESGGREQVRALASALPWPIRLGLDLPGRRLGVVAGGAVILLLAVVAGWRAGGGETPPDEVLYVLEAGKGAQVQRRVEIRRADWRRDDPLPPGESVQAPRWSVRFPETPPMPNPSGTEWAGRITSRDSGGQDLYLLKSDGSLQRLTYAPGDDNWPAWSPDGSRIVYESAEWNPDSHYDLAIRDMTTGATRRLTTGDAEDQMPRWSPDGTRIAFTRSYFDGRPRDICWTSTDGSRLSCVGLPAVQVGNALGWLDDRQMVVQAESAGVLAIRLLDVEDGAVEAVSIPEAQSAWLSPDGGWLLLQGVMPGTSRAAWWVAPLADPTAVRRLTVTSEHPTRILWGGLPRRPAYLDLLRVQVGAGRVPVGVPYQLRAEGLDPEGEVVRARALSWRSGNEAVATVDSTGMLRPRRTGSVVVYASAGGWRSDSANLTIGRVSDSIVLDESWRGRIEDEWVPFGDPRPRTVDLARGARAFWNNGDSSYKSGVYSKRAWSATGALGAEATFMVKLSTIQWQTQTMSLDASLDSAALAQWDHRTGALDERRTLADARCSVEFPNQQGPPDSARIGVSTVEGDQFAAPRDMRLGNPHRLRVQILPDGRCGVALDGRAMFISRGSVSLDRPFRLVLQGMSHDTRVLVGGVEVWQGVRGDVDWSAVPRR
jgi:DNA-binding SARP family transcriptional activator